MGCEFNFAKLNGTPAEVKQKFEKMVDSALYDYGHAGYTGSWAEAGGIEIQAQPCFETDDVAEAWLEDNAEKWGPALAVKVAQPEPHWAIGAWCSS